MSSQNFEPSNSHPVATAGGAARPSRGTLGRWDDDGGRVPEDVGRAEDALALAVGGEAAPAEKLVLLDGGDETYPRMLDAIASATRMIHLETYAFGAAGVGERFVEALRGAAGRGVYVYVVLDGWGSAWDGRAVASALRESGCEVVIFNRLRSLFVGRLGRNHRKVLLVDDALAFIGGINIGDENVGRGSRIAWADLTVAIEGPQCARLGQMLRGERPTPVASSMSMYLCGLGGGWRLRRRYIKAFRAARKSLMIAHGYFLPDRGVIRAIKAASRRGVDVRLLLAGRSDVPFARLATRRLYRGLLAAGVRIHEWDESVLHAKVAAADGRLLLLGSFNLDPVSLANLETLVEVSDETVVMQGEAWIANRFRASRTVTTVEANSRVQRWLLDPAGYLIARIAVAVSRLVGGPR